MQIQAPIRFAEFVKLGAHQHYQIHNPLASLFFQWVGPLGTHARIRNTRLIHTLDGIDLAQKRVLDVGCGHGYVLFWLAQRFPSAQFEGMDTDAAQIAGCQKAAAAMNLTNLNFSVGTYHNLRAGDHFDLIIAIDVLEHVEDDMQMLAALYNHLRPAGNLAIHVPLRHQRQRRIFPVFRQHLVADHVRDEYLPDEIQSKVTGTGLEIVTFGYGFGFWGELSFELNNFFWHKPALRAAVALLTLPVALVAGYLDTRSHLVFGNSMALLARRPR